MQEGLDGATDSAKKLKNQLQGFDKLNNITTANAANVDGAIGGTIDLSSQIKDATEAYQKAWNEAYSQMENKAQEFAKNIGKSLEPIKKLFQDFAIGDYFAVGQDVTKLIVGITDFFTKAINNVDWEKFGNDIGNFIKGIEWTEILSSVGELIWSAINAGIELYGDTFNVAPIETAIITAIATLTLTPLGGIVAGKIAAAITAALASTDIIYIVATAFKSLLTGASVEGTLALFTAFQINLAGIGSIIGGVFSAVSSFVSMFVNGFNIIKEAVMLVGIALTAVGAIILGAPALISGIIAGVVAALATLVIVVKDNWGKITSFFSNMATAISVVFDNVVYVFKNNFLPELTRGFYNTINGILGFFEALANGAISAINFIIKGMNKIKFNVPSWVPQIGGKSFGFDIKLIKNVSIPRFETGGFPEDGWFRASKGEYFGSFDDGTSVIANNNQIISGISNGVKSANAEQNALLREQNALLRQILAKDTGISTRDIFDAVRSENRNYINRNGESAFAY
jgi:hypothetical protein